MVEIVPQITFPSLNAAVSVDDFRLHEAALEWSLADPILINSPDDIKSTVYWKDRLEPFVHQIRNLITFCRRLPVTLITDDVGLGKTISAGLILSELMVRNRVSRTLIICPSILGPQWVEELESKFGIEGVFAKGAELDEQLEGTSEVVMTTYQTASTRLEKIEPGKFDMLIIDEAHKLRNLYGSPKSPKMAENIRKALDSRLFKYVLLLTATPIQNRLWDIYSLVDCLSVAKGHANPLGNSDQFKTRYIADRHGRQLRPLMAEDFRSILRQYLARTRRQDASLTFPDREVRLYEVQPSIVDTKLMALIALNIDRLNGFQQSSVGVAMMSSPQALIAQLYNMAKRDPYWSAVADDAKRIIREGLLPSKLTGLLKIIELNRTERPADWRVLVFTTRIETQNVICQKLDAMGIAFGTIQGGDPVKNNATAKAFSTAPPKINVIVSTDAGAEGVNLQSGNVLVNYDLPWNPMVVEQRIGRIQRLGSKHGHVVIHNMAVIGSPEQKIVTRLLSKLQVIVETVGDIEGILEATFGDRDDSAESFEKQIRDLFVKSLKGQDVEEAVRRQVRSIERAKAEYEEHEEFMNDTLGRLDDLHESGPSMPRLTKVSPSMTPNEFVKEAFEADGYNLSEVNDNEICAEKRGRPPEYITFDEQYWRATARGDTSNRKMLNLYRPGKPAFEKLVQRWIDRSGHFTKSFIDQTQRLAHDLVRRWVDRIENSTLRNVKVISAKEKFQGKARLRVTASNAVDSYEKLVELETVPEGHNRVFDRTIENGRVVYQALQEDEIDETIKQASRSAAAADPDIAGFCQFYNSRLKEELAKVGNDGHRLKKVQDDFSPALHAQTVAVTGIRYQECRLSIEFEIDGIDGYSAEILAIPLTGQVVTEFDTWAKCEKSSRSVPSACLDACCVSKKRVLRHYLRRSDESGRKALEEHVNVCSVTGRVALNDEFLTSDLSSRRAVASVFQTSEMSGRRGLQDECSRCQFTGSLILSDEFETSNISGKIYRRDHRCVSAVSEQAGHHSEFVTCESSKTPALHNECRRSDLSNRLIRKDLLEASSRPPNRLGARDEIVLCPVTGNLLLTDETGKCAITQQVVDDSLLGSSDESSRKALATLLVTCELSGRRLLPDEVVSSVVSDRRVSRRLAAFSAQSRKAMLPVESVICQITGVILLPMELATSDLSGKKFRNDEQVTSDVSGRIGHRSEGVTCEWSGEQLLADEGCRSTVSGRVMKQSLALKSPISGRIAHPKEFQKCQFSGTLVLPDELVSSDNSCKLTRIDEVFVSETGRRGHRSEEATCEYSGQRLLFDEVVASSVSGKLISKSIARRSAVSGCLAAPQEILTCEFTDVELLPSELLVSDLSGKRFRRDQLVRSAKSQRVGHSTESSVCEYSGLTFLIDELGVSDLSRKSVALIYLHQSPGTGRNGTPDEFGRCTVSGQQLLLDELSMSEVSRKSVDRNLLVASAHSGYLALPEEMVRCQASGVSLLPRETVTCAVTGMVVDSRLVVQSDFSAKKALKDRMLTCSVTGRRGVPAEFGKCELTGDLVERSMLEECEVTKQFVRRDRMVQSAFNQRWMRADHAKKSIRNGDLMCPDEAGFCIWNEGYLHKSLVKRCRWTRLTFSSDLIDEGGVLRVLTVAEEGTSDNVFDADNSLLQWMKSQRNGSLKKIANVRYIESPKGHVLAVFGELRNLFGFEIGKVAFIVRKTAKGMSIPGAIAFGSIDGTNWNSLTD